ncbi:glucose-induced degradation protein 4 [Cladorrhinum sp. PSN332]|nr:glucose-induced degradation protein 4 [Cladorrhinum sp. PSN332]
MPTPSSNTPDSQSPRSFPFTSTCPDLEDHPSLSSSPTISQEHPSPSNWRRHSLPPYATESEDGDQVMTNGPDALTPDTMSPHPNQDAHDVETDREQDVAGVAVARTGAEESHKQSEVEESRSSGGGDDARRVRSSRGTSRGGKQEVTRPTDSATGGEPSSASRSKRTPERHSPVPGEVEDVHVWGPVGKGPRWVEDSGLVGLGNEYSHMRSIPTTSSSYLRPGCKFEGTQQSERQRYDVEVEIKHVDMRESFLCGYLKIQGLTDDHPTLTTYFEGEIIGTKHGFVTQHPQWGATEKIDHNHWSKFTAFRPYAKVARKGGQIYIKDNGQREYVFMRWKEHFLVPDHRVRTINGASFEGFYYICFNQIKGEVNGIYFHSKSEKFQQLELRHVRNQGCYGAMEFR